MFEAHVSNVTLPGLVILNRWYRGHLRQHHASTTPAPRQHHVITTSSPRQHRVSTTSEPQSAPQPAPRQHHSQHHVNTMASTTSAPWAPAFDTSMLSHQDAISDDFTHGERADNNTKVAVLLLVCPHTGLPAMYAPLHKVPVVGVRGTLAVS